MFRIFPIILFFIASCNFNNTSQINFIDDFEIYDFEDYEYLLVDLRTAEEFSSGFIKNAVNIDYYSEKFRPKILSLKKDQTIFLYCKTDNRSINTAKLLLENGFVDVNVIEGGITSWVNRGNDLEYFIID
tara:strand:- start:894 stop:1283 length:390 start_codon:yes stop_codon:yes gene_type:complete